MLTSKLKGEYKLKVYRPDGSLRKETEWFDNIILNRGLDLIAAGNGASSFANCSVGSGTTTPAVTQTALTNLQLSTTTKQSGSNTWYSSPDYYYEHIITYRFAAIGAGLSYNLNEVGVGKTSTELFSRALITDSGGTPTTVSIVEGEILDVIYKFRNYPPLTTADYSQDVTISGTTYTFTWRPAYVGDSNRWFILNTVSPTYHYLTGYSGAVGAITSVPGGTASTQVSNTAPAAYTIGSYTSTATMSFGLTNANFGGGITSFRYSRGGNGSTSHFDYQCSVSPAIAKTSAQSLQIVGQMSFARY